MSETDEIAWLRERLERATPGPWEADAMNHSSPDQVCAFDEQGPYVLASVNAPMATDTDARAIAALGTLWPELLAVVEASETHKRACDGGYASSSHRLGIWEASEILRAAIRAHRGRVDG